MLFNSTFFLFAFLPIVLGGFLVLQRWGGSRLTVAWLVAASLLFYGWEQPEFLLLLGVSVAGNFALGVAIQDAGSTRTRRLLCGIGVALDLAGLGFFKYAGFAVETWNRLFSSGWSFEAIALPLSISFFTFQQISYLVDTAQGAVRERRFLDYALFVTFFPKLVAGPIVRHDEMLDQVGTLPDRRVDLTDVAVGLTLFAMGLFKKVVLADAVAGRTSGLFDAAADGQMLGLFEAWAAALGFTLQVYFDFSGYTDMALGLARCFGFVLPLNFFSPYRATNISEFWRRWHVTLTRWLRLYLFVPISRRIMRRGERFEVTAIAAAQMVTMLLCGLWHGAGWTFVVWGGLHGVLLVLHDGWTSLKRRAGLEGLLPKQLADGLGRVLLLLVLAATFVVFRADDLAVAGEMLRSLCGVDGFAVARVGLGDAVGLGVLTAIVWLAPNSQEILSDFGPALDMRRFSREPRRLRVRWQPVPAWSPAAIACLVPAIYFILVEGHEEFIYRFF